jgi:hypothetical protein
MGESSGPNRALGGPGMEVRDTVGPLKDYGSHVPHQRIGPGPVGACKAVGRTKSGRGGKSLLGRATWV